MYVRERFHGSMLNVQACFELWATKIEFIGVLKVLLVVFDHVAHLRDLLLAELNRPRLSRGKSLAGTQTNLRCCISMNATWNWDYEVLYLRDVFEWGW